MTSPDLPAPPPVPTFTARHPTDLVALAPVVLGFHPADSVVLMTFGSPGGAFHARVDLAHDDLGRREVTAVLLEAARSNQVRTAAVLLYTDDAEAAELQGVLLLDGLLDLGVGVVEVMRVGERAWWAVPDDGTGGTAYDLDSHRFTAQRVYDGRVVHRDRAELAESLSPGDDDQDRAEVAAHAAECGALLTTAGAAALRREARWLQQTVRAHVDGARVEPRTAGRMLAMAAVVPVRDVAWAEISRADSRRHVDLWRGLVRRAPRHLLPGACALLAFAAWQHGDGALAWCAIDRCQEVEPEHSMASCVAEALLRAVPPGVWEPVAEEDLEVFAGEGGGAGAGPAAPPRGSWAS